LAGCGVDRDDVLHDRLPVNRLSGASLGKLLISQRFGMSARKGKNGFMRRRIVSSRRARRNIRGLNASNFNERKIGRVAATAPLPYLAPLAGIGFAR
jgi:hypothetical protein